MTTERLNSIRKYIPVLAAVYVHLAVGVYGEGAQPMSDCKVSQAQAIFATGLSADNLTEALTLVDAILTEDGHDRALSASLFQAFLATKTSSRDRGDEDITMMETVAVHIMSTTDLSSEAARRNSMLVSRWLGRLRDEIIPDFSRLPVAANIGPPPGVPGFAGMRPDAISDPTVRSEYEAAIQANRYNSQMNRRQHTLSRVERRMGKQVRDFLADLAHKASISTEHLDRCMREAYMQREGEPK